MAQIYTTGPKPRQQTFYALSNAERDEIVKDCLTMWMYICEFGEPARWEKRDTEIVRDLPYHIGEVGLHWEPAKHVCLQLDPTEAQLKNFNWAASKLQKMLNVTPFRVGAGYHTALPTGGIGGRMQARRDDIYDWACRNVSALRSYQDKNPLFIDTVLAPHAFHDKELRSKLHALLNTSTSALDESPLFSFGAD
jgi:hypothetical protein